LQKRTKKLFDVGGVVWMRQSAQSHERSCFARGQGFLQKKALRHE
jgi:hypothetical protein